MVALYGMNPLAYIRTRNQEERTLMQAIAQAAARLQYDQDLNRARMIANEVSRAFGGK